MYRTRSNWPPRNRALILCALFLAASGCASTESESDNDKLRNRRWLENNYPKDRYWSTRLANREPGVPAVAESLSLSPTSRAARSVKRSRLASPSSTTSPAQSIESPRVDTKADAYARQFTTTAATQWSVPSSTLYEQTPASLEEETFGIRETETRWRAIVLP